MTLLALLVALALAATAASAPAGSSALPPPNALFGGGSIGPAYALRHGNVHFTSIRVSPDGRTVTLHGDWRARCDGLKAPVTASFVARDLPLDRVGSFTGTGPIETPLATGTFTIAGAFVEPRSASGSGSVTFAYTRDGRTHSCAVFVDWETRAAPRREGRPAPVRGAAYYGVTSQSYPFLLRVSKDGRKVAHAALIWDARCTGTPDGTGGDAVAHATPIRRGSRFELAFAEIERPAPGQLAVTSSTLRGVFGEGSVSGVWSVTRTVRSDDGTLLDSCSSGPVSFAARL